MPTLITAYEVVKYAPVEPTYPTGDICKHIQRIEALIFKKCWLGWGFHALLKTKLTDISAVPEFDPDITYAEDALVCYDGCVFQSLKDDNDVHINEDEELNPCWQIAPKFTDDCYNQLWNDGGLKYWLAMEIIYKTVRYTAYKAGAKGLLKMVDDNAGSETVSVKEFNAWKGELRIDTDDQMEIMYDWMCEISKATGTACSFISIQKIYDECSGDDTCLSPRKTRRRRWHFNK